MSASRIGAEGTPKPWRTSNASCSSEAPFESCSRIQPARATVHSGHRFLVPWACPPPTRRGSGMSSRITHLRITGEGAPAAATTSSRLANLADACTMVQHHRNGVRAKVGKLGGWTSSPPARPRRRATALSTLRVRLWPRAWGWRICDAIPAAAGPLPRPDPAQRSLFRRASAPAMASSCRARRSAAGTSSSPTWSSRSWRRCCEMRSKPRTCAPWPLVDAFLPPVIR
jgi:hypothetical protein